MQVEYLAILAGYKTAVAQQFMRVDCHRHTITDTGFCTFFS